MAGACLGPPGRPVSSPGAAADDKPFDPSIGKPAAQPVETKDGGVERAARDAGNEAIVQGHSSPKGPGTDPASDAAGVSDTSMHDRWAVLSYVKIHGQFVYVCMYVWARFLGEEDAAVTEPY